MEHALRERGLRHIDRSGTPWYGEACSLESLAALELVEADPCPLGVRQHGYYSNIGQTLSGASKRTANRAAQALRLAAAALRSSQSSLGAYFRRLSARLDRAKAITATAHKLARLIYTMLTKGTEYPDQGQDYYEERYRQRVMHHLAKRAEKLGLQLTPIPQAA